MTTTPEPLDPTVQLLRERWLKEASNAFDLMFDPDPAKRRLLSFEQRERTAAELGQQLALFLLQQHAHTDQPDDPLELRPQPCPRCQRLIEPGEDPDERQARDLVTSCGPARLTRRRFRCQACRLVFFPQR